LPRFEPCAGLEHSVVYTLKWTCLVGESHGPNISILEVFASQLDCPQDWTLVYTLKGYAYWVKPHGPSLSISEVFA
jgi:hypothetical protein